jgi:hypothetical protein
MKILFALIAAVMLSGCANFVAIKKGNDFYVRDSTNFNGRTEIRPDGTLIREGQQDASTPTRELWQGANGLVRSGLFTGGAAAVTGGAFGPKGEPGQSYAEYSKPAEQQTLYHGGETIKSQVP